MSNDLTLEAVFSAQTDQLESALGGLVSAINDASSALTEKLAAAAEQSGSAVDKLGEKAEESSRSFTEAFGEMGESVKHLVEVLGVFEGISILKEQVSQTLEFGESLQRMSVMTGASTDFLQKLDFAAKATGTSVDGLTMAATRLTRAYAEIQSGAGSPQLLASLKNSGIDPSQLSSMQTGIEAVSAAINKMGVESAKSRDLVTELFGRQGLNYLPLLANFQELSEKADQLGVVLGGNLIGRLDQAQEALNTLGAVVDADKERLGAAFAPAIEAAANELVLLASGIGKLEQGQGMETFSKNATNAFYDLAEDIVTAEVEIIKFGETVESVASKMESIGHAIAAPFEWVASAVSGAADQMYSMTTTGQFDYGAAMQPPGAGGAESGAIQQQRDALEAARQAALSHLNSPTGGAGAQGAGAQDQSIPATESAQKINEANEKELQTYEASQQLEVQIANSTAAAKVEAAQNVYNKAVSLFGDQSKEAEKAGAAELAARREQYDQTRALDAQEIADNATNQTSMMSLQKGVLDQQVAQHQITKQQELATEQSMAGQELAIRESEFDKLAALYSDDEKTKERFEQAKVQAAINAQKEIQDFQAQSFAATQQQQQAAENALTQTMERGLSSLEGSSGGMRSVMLSVFKDIESAFNSLITEMVAKWLASTAIFQRYSAGSANGGGFLGGASAAMGGLWNGGTPQTMSAIAANPALSGMGITANMIEGPLQTAWEGISGTVTSVFGEAFSGSQSILSSIFGAIFGGLGGGTGGGGIGSVFSSAASLGTAALAFFKEGGIVPSAAGGMIVPAGSGGTLAMLHQKEMVLPAPISQTVMDMANGGNRNGRSEGGGGDTHIHLNTAIHAIDSDSFKDHLSDHAEHMAHLVRDQLERHSQRLRGTPQRRR